MPEGAEVVPRNNFEDMVNEKDWLPIPRVKDDKNARANVHDMAMKPREKPPVRFRGIPRYIVVLIPTAESEDTPFREGIVGALTFAAVNRNAVGGFRLPRPIPVMIGAVPGIITGLDRQRFTANVRVCAPNVQRPQSFSNVLPLSLRNPEELVAAVIG